MGNLPPAGKALEAAEAERHYNTHAKNTGNMLLSGTTVEAFKSAN